MKKREIPLEKVEINTKIRNLTPKRKFPVKKGKLPRKQENSFGKSGN